MYSTVKKGINPCMNCQSCASIIKGPEFHHPRKGYPIPVRGYYTCNSQNVLKCPCGISYVGQTSRPMKIRLNEHKSNIRLYGNKIASEQQSLEMSRKWKFGETTVAEHFYEYHYQVSDLVAHY